jgi:hypothetical protein
MKQTCLVVVVRVTVCGYLIGAGSDRTIKGALNMPCRIEKMFTRELCIYFMYMVTILSRVAIAEHWVP